MTSTNFNDSCTSAVNFPEMAIEFNENEFDDEMEPENTEVLQYETFLLYARSENPSDREIAIRNLSRLSGIMSIEKKQRQIEVIFSLIENVFAKERDSKLCVLLVEQVPLLYIEFMALEYLLKKVHKVFPLLLANSLEHTTDGVRKSAIGAIDVLVEQRILPQGSLQNVICPVLFGHCYCPADYSHFISDDQRVESLTLLCKIVTWPGALTKRWIFENFLGRYSILLQDTAFQVRKACGRNFTHTLRNIFFSLCQHRDCLTGGNEATERDIMIKVDVREIIPRMSNTSTELPCPSLSLILKNYFQKMFDRKMIRYI